MIGLTTNRKFGKIRSMTNAWSEDSLMEVLYEIVDDVTDPDVHREGLFALHQIENLLETLVICLKKWEVNNWDAVTPEENALINALSNLYDAGIDLPEKIVKPALHGKPYTLSKVSKQFDEADYIDRLIEDDE